MNKMQANYRPIKSIKPKYPFQECLFQDLVQMTPKQNFSHKLRGKGKRYKRYLGSPLRYACGKSWAVGYVF